MFFQPSLTVFPIMPHQLLLFHILPDQLKLACWKSVFLEEICLSLAGSLCKSVLPPKMPPTQNKSSD